MRPGKGRKLKARVSISRSSHGGIVIEVRDEDSRIQFLQLEMSAEAFGEAVTGLSERDAEAEVYGLELLGTRAEHKHERISVGSGVTWEGCEAAAAEALSSLEVDGWRARRSDVSNQHNWRRERGRWVLTIGLFRYVDKVSGEPVAVEGSKP